MVYIIQAYLEGKKVSKFTGQKYLRNYKVNEGELLHANRNCLKGYPFKANNFTVISNNLCLVE